MQNQKALGILPLPKDVKNKGRASAFQFSPSFPFSGDIFLGFTAKLVVKACWTCVVPLPGSQWNTVCHVTHDVCECFLMTQHFFQKTKFGVT